MPTVPISLGGCSADSTDILLVEAVVASGTGRLTMRLANLSAATTCHGVPVVMTVERFTLRVFDGPVRTDVWAERTGAGWTVGSDGPLWGSAIGGNAIEWTIPLAPADHATVFGTAESLVRIDPAGGLGQAMRVRDGAAPFAVRG